MFTKVENINISSRVLVFLWAFKMNLKEYIEQLQEFAKENPRALEFDVWYAKDDEGNGYQEVYFSPSLKVYDIDDKYNDRCDCMYSDDEGDEIGDIIENDRRMAVIVN